MEKAVVLFRGENYFLSNFYEAEVEFEGLRFHSSEAAYQAQKCADVSLMPEFTELSAHEAKEKGQIIEVRADWDEVKVPIMERIVRAKFTQNPELAKKLADTGDVPLVEGNDWGDTFWGVSGGVGENHLGRILMKIRAEICKKAL